MYRHSAEEEEVVPQKLKKSAKQMETKKGKDNLHVKERYNVIVFSFEQLQCTCTYRVVSFISKLNCSP